MRIVHKKRGTALRLDAKITRRRIKPIWGGDRKGRKTELRKGLALLGRDRGGN